MRQWKPVPRHPNIYSYETKRGTKYGVRRGFKNGVGKRDEFTRSGFTHWREAEAALRRFEADMVSNKINPITHRGVTVDQYFRSMCERNEKLGVWREATLQSKKTYYNAHIKAPFGNTPLSQVTRKSYQDFIDSMILEHHFAQSTMQTLDSVMQVIMNDAERNDIIDKNRLSGILINGAKPPKPVAVSDEDYKAFMAKAAEILSKYEMAMVYLLTIGERREELCGLMFKSFERGEQDGQPYYAITYTVARTQYDVTGGPLKTPSAYRTNYVSGSIVDWIDYALLYAKNAMRRTHREITPESFIFINPKTGMPIHPSNVNRLFLRVKKASGIEVRPHMLRHYFATKALEDGLPGMSVMHWVGHKDMSMTNSYTTPSESGSRKVGNAMNNIVLNRPDAGADSQGGTK